MRAGYRIETKSKKDSAKQTEYRPWALGRGDILPSSQRLHRQYFLDRVALVPHGTLGIKLTNNIEWWFQEFKRKNKENNSYTLKDLESVRTWVRQQTNNISVFKNSLKFSKIAENRSPLEIAKVNKTIKLFSIKKWIIQTQVKARLLEGLDDLTIQENITSEGVNDLL